MRRERINTDWIVEIAKKCNNACLKCGTSKCLEIHHITPLNKGGADNTENTILLCKICHKLVHNKKNEKQFYNESLQDFKDYNYSKHNDWWSGETGWEMDIDSTDHFQFNCPKCKCEAAVYKMFIRDFNSLATPPCFYFYLKCPSCRVSGQRKIYLGFSLDKIEELEKKNNEGKN